MKLRYDNLYINKPSDIGITVSDLQEWLRWEASSTSSEAINFENNVLLDSLKSAYYVAERICGRAIAEQTRTYIFNSTTDFDNKCELRIQGGHIQSFVAKIIAEDDTETIETTKFITTINNTVSDCVLPIIKLKSTEYLTESTRELGKFVLIVTCGWATLPDDIATAIKQLASYIYSNRDVWLEGEITDSQVIKSAGSQILYNYKVY